MISKEQFQQLKEKFGDYSSFAIWKSDECVGEISFFDSEDIVKAINNDYIFIALNPAKRDKEQQQSGQKFKNFHSDYSHQKDFKLCFALQNTKYWGSYITDLYKSFKESDCTKLPQMLKEEPLNSEQDKEKLKEEIRILTQNKKNVILIALGRMTEKHLKKLFENEFKIVYARHYSFWGSKNDYKELVLRMLKDQGI